MKLDRDFSNKGWGRNKAHSDGFWLYQGGHHAAIMRGGSSVASFTGLGGWTTKGDPQSEKLISLLDDIVDLLSEPDDT